MQIKDNKNYILKVYKFIWLSFMNPNNIKQEIEPAVNSFMELGLTRYESLILSILAALGTSTVKEIHKHTDVPLPKVYQTLDSLTGKGFIKQHSKTRPVEYTAYSTEIITRKMEENNRALELKLKQNLENLTELSKPSFAGDISPFNGLENFKRIGTGVILNAKKQLSVAMSTSTLQIFSNELEIIREKGINLRSLTFSQLKKSSSDFSPAKFQKLGFSHHEVDVPIKLSPNLKFFSILQGLISVIDYLGIIISDNNESIVLLPLFPHETFFGIWIYSSQIIDRQLKAYNELIKIARKT